MMCPVTQGSAPAFLAVNRSALRASGSAPGDRQGVWGASPLRWRPSESHRPRAVRRVPWGPGRSVGRGSRRLAI